MPKFAMVAICRMEVSAKFWHVYTSRQLRYLARNNPEAPEMPDVEKIADNRLKGGRNIAPQKWLRGAVGKAKGKHVLKSAPEETRANTSSGCCYAQYAFWLEESIFLAKSRSTVSGFYSDFALGTYMY